MDSITILDRLIAFPTVSRDSNLQLVGWARERLAERGVDCSLVHDATGTKANLYASIGPADRPGVMLSGHTDVVPVEGQDWTVPPFALTRRDGRLYGRGAADMKGFVACALAAALRATERRLAAPLRLALSYDEEVGCIGVRRLIEALADAPVRPAFCIVGEPTSMTVATGHKGKTALEATCVGREGHSAMAPMALNALHLGCDLVAAIRSRQAEIAASGPRDGDYDVPYTTLHVGRMAGGTALNIVPNHCQLDFEIRNLAADDPEALIATLRSDAARIAEAARARAPEADIRIEVRNTYPGLGTAPDAAVVTFVKSLTGANGTTKVAFGTEGGLFSERLGIPTVVCGPGSMAQGHRPDEYIAIDQISRCDAMLDALLDRLAAGI
ncbi:acetylornithine deacetylase [Amaricoccus sp.]|uniref:acetylornithine deacetylase n=1 Tax=Amaricoccus sp. TaxID=1872485 RepID=UPI001B45279B|nr:acetylornithine deacetylase [Amaricoccus sp.]MBP7243048.1 acetylornithine deacetylase [Amaricoccus sp.]